MIQWLSASLQRQSELAVGRTSHNLKDYSYSELWSQVESLRQELRHERYRGVNCVGILGQRSFQSTSLVLACLFEGIPFAPLNPKWPLHRIQSIVQQLKLNQIWFEPRYDWVKLPSETENIEIKVTHEVLEMTFPKKVDVEEFAYFISTSGSTGAPKIVGVTRKNLDTFLYSIQSAIPLSSKDRLTQMYDLSFDLGIAELVWAVVMGASLHPFEPTEVGFLKLYFKTAVPTVWSSTPSFLRFVLSQGVDLELEQSLRLSLFCGEQLFAEDIAPWKSINKNSRIFNLYGPTETTIYASFFEVKDFESISGPVPIGMALPKVQLKVDPTNSELLIGGDQVASGYYKNELETRQKFFDDDGTRWYRSGDCVDLLPDGNFIFKGRLDRQVKLNGYRIELDEIETCAIANLKMECAAELHNDEIVLYTRQRINDLEVARSILSQHLPAYSLPTQFIYVEKWPVDSNGKINRKFLGKLE